MRIERIELKGVGPFDDAVFEIPEPKGLGELVLFEGPNGCGKTTVAEVLTGLAKDILNLKFSGKAPPSGSGLDMRRRLRGVDQRVTIQLDEGDGAHPTMCNWSGTDARSLLRGDFQYTPGIAPRSPRQMSWLAFAYNARHPVASFDSKGPMAMAVPSVAGGLSFGTVAPASKDLGQLLTNIEYDRVRAANYARDDGGDAASRADAAAVAESRRDSIRRFADTLSQMLDRRVEIDFPLGQFDPRVRFDREAIPIDLLGAGLTSTISWLADLLVRLETTRWQDPRRSPFGEEFWLILDEVDEGLHPKAQRLVLPAVRRLFPNARIYATTHSPFVVASAGEGVVFAIRPDPKTRHVNGPIPARQLEHGQSLAWVVDEIFDAPSGFVDKESLDALKTHRDAVDALRRGEAIDWDAFFAGRTFLMGLNEEVSTVVAMREVPVRKQINDALASRPSVTGP